MSSFLSVLLPVKNVQGTLAATVHEILELVSECTKDFELLIIDDAFRNMINKDSSVNNMRQVFHKSGNRSLFEDGLLKVNQGLTTIDEVLRVTEVYGKTENEAFIEND